MMMEMDIETAGRLLNFGARMGEGQRAQEQLEGAVAIYNILRKHRVAYLADEVGMGKTYVALGALALFRHLYPGFRTLVITPRENIQYKWMKEMRKFSSDIMRFRDLRVSSITGQPIYPLVGCKNLPDFVNEVIADSRRDFFLRLSSFSLALGDDTDKWGQLRDKLRKALPWLPAEEFNLHSKDDFKDNFARAVCCALPLFDLVIVDEGHNLKHGYSPSAAARNRVVAHSFGRPDELKKNSAFPDYGPRIKRVLFLSATPVEESYRQIWNQLDVFGFGEKFRDLCRDDISEEQKKQLVSEFLIRRVTSIKVGSQELTKNLYRREWYNGGVLRHDEPIEVKDDRQKLVVALIQKKVAELLDSEKFNFTFQIGMLASFESFLQTAKLKKEDETIFDDAEQSDIADERDGIDVKDLNRLSKDYRKTFQDELPHPKMDVIVDSLSDSWKTGDKALVFVRRVASVKELKRKLDRRYDNWLISSLQQRLPKSVLDRFNNLVKKYNEEKQEHESLRQDLLENFSGLDTESDEPQKDKGGNDTFFAWFFRGEGPKGVVSGANIQNRFISKSSNYATFFKENYIAELLCVQPGNVLIKLASETGRDLNDLRKELRELARKYLSRAKKHAGAEIMESAQAAALEILKEREDSLGKRARMIWHQLFESRTYKNCTEEPPDVAPWLDQPTFFTELRREDRLELRKALWPEPEEKKDDEDRFREQELRGQLLAAAARLGHPIIDLYILTIKRLGSMELRTMESSSSEEAEQSGFRRINEYLDLLEQQRLMKSDRHDWNSFDELSAISENFNLILDVNATDVRDKPLTETARFFGVLMGEQRPVGGMSGQVSKTLVHQFRMPGYPMVLISTDLLQEGEDLHTFCSKIIHYGISWTPSSMEQRIGRIDRVRSQTDRRLSKLAALPDGESLLQVYYPYLGETIEFIQVRKVLRRMNKFLRLMHEGLTMPGGYNPKIDLSQESVGNQYQIERITTPLESAFPIQQWAIKGTGARLATGEMIALEAEERFQALKQACFANDGMDVKWQKDQKINELCGAVSFEGAPEQSFKLILRSDGDYLVIRCSSHIDSVYSKDEHDELIAKIINYRFVRIEGPLSNTFENYSLFIEDYVMLAKSDYDRARLAFLLKRVVNHARMIRNSTAILSGYQQDLSSKSNKEEQRQGEQNWHKYCKNQDNISVDGDTVTVQFAEKRRHQITVRNCGEIYDISGIVARKADIKGLDDLSVKVNKRNLNTKLAGFRVDQSGRLVGEAWVSKTGLGAKEFLFYIRRLAAECDRFEYLLTGSDRQ